MDQKTIAKNKLQVVCFSLFTREAYDEEERDNDEGVDTIGGDPVLFPIWDNDEDVEENIFLELGEL